MDDIELSVTLIVSKTWIASPSDSLYNISISKTFNLSFNVFTGNSVGIWIRTSWTLFSKNDTIVLAWVVSKSDL